MPVAPDSLFAVLTTLLGGRAFAERFGTGPTEVVALHGWGRSRADFAATLQGYDALALDLPGFGAAPAPGTGWTTSEYAGWTAEIVGELDRPVIVGHSFGGRVAVKLAAARPELVRGVVLTGVPLLRAGTTTSVKPKFSYRLARALHQRGLLPDERMEALRRANGSADYRAAEGVMRDVLVKAVNEDYAPELAAIRAHHVPVTMVWGEHDSAAPVEMAARAQRALGGGAELSVVPGSAHLLDAALIEALRQAVEDLRARE